ncbi:MAG TPA: hypothetical protein VFC26_01225, partial [Verrucomicrobiae bacterium]|nr:hypothetical protein [Verrucomicrobiae bacterium]
MKTTCSFSCLTVLMLVGQPLEASVIEAWVQRYSVVVSNSNDTMVRVVTDQAGDVVVAGYTEDGTGSEMLTIKYSGN